MEMEEKQAQVCQETGAEALDAGEQEDFETLIRGKYKEEFDARVRKILDGRLRGMRQENLRLKEQQLQEPPRRPECPCLLCDPEERTRE